MNITKLSTPKQLTKNNLNLPIQVLFLMLIFSLLTLPTFAVSQDLFEEVKKRVSVIDSDSLKKMVDEKSQFVLLDVRMPSEIKRMGKIDATQNKEIPRGWLEIRIGNLVADKNTPIVTYCGGGIRSAFAADTLTQMGYTNVKNYADGFLGWEGKGYPAKYD